MRRILCAALIANSVRIFITQALTGYYHAYQVTYLFHTDSQLLALSAFHANDMAAARLWLDQISADTDTPPSLRSRAQALQALLPPVAKS